LLLAGLLVAFAPRIASSGMVRERVEAWLSEELGAQVTIQEIDLGWSGPLAARGLSIHLSQGEFSGDELASLAEARLENGLWALWRGTDSIQAHVTGLHLNVDERGGGRTNLDPFLRRFLPSRPDAAAPVPTPDEPAAEERPLQLPRFDITLADCTLRVRRMPYSPPERRMNPFREDIPVRAAQTGFDTYQLAAASLRVRIDGDKIDAQVEGSLSHGPDTTSFRADVKVRDGIPQGTVDLEEFDLDLMDPFVAGKLSGRVSARAEGRFENGLLSATLALEIHDLVTDRLQEEWIRTTIHLNEKESLYAIHPLDVRSASGRFALAGGLDIPKDEPYRPSGDVTGTFPLAMAYRAFVHRQPPVQAQVRFSLKSQLEHEGGHAAGTVYLDHFTLEDNLGEFALAFDLIGDRAEKNLRIDLLELRSEHGTASVRGRLHHGRDWTLDLTGGGDGDLARIRHIAEHFVPRIQDFDLAGRCSFQVHALHTESDGTTTLRADLTAVGLKTRGIEPAIIDYPDLSAHLDASLLDGGNRLIVNAARIQGVELTGSARGLLDPAASPEAAATAKGTFPLSPRVVQFIGIDGFRNPEGNADVDLKFVAAGGNARLEGAIGLRGVDFQIGEYDHADPDVDWKGVVVWRDSKLTGNFTLNSPRLQANVHDLSYDPGANTVRTRAKLTIPDATPLRDLLLDSRWQWSGRHEAEIEFSASPDVLWIAGEVRAPKLVFQFNGHGLAGDGTQAKARAVYKNGEWFLRDTVVRIPARKLVAATKELRLHPGDVSGDITLSGRFEKLHTLVERLGEWDVRGEFRIASDLRIGESFEGSIDVDAPAFAIGAERLGDVTIRVPQASMGRNVRVPQFSLRIGEDLSATGAVRLDDELDLRIQAQGSDFGWITHFIDGVDGHGAFSISADVVAPRLQRDGAYALSGAANTEFVKFRGGGMLHSPKVVAKEFRFRTDGGHLHDLKIDAKVSAKSVERHQLLARNVVFHSTSSGSIMADGSGTGHRIHLVTSADWIRMEERRLDGLTLDGWGVLKSLDLDDARAVQFNGKLRFERVPAAAIDWTAGTAEFSYGSHVLDVKKLVATVQEGRMTGSARFDFRHAQVPWSVKIKTVDAKIDKNFADPLSFIIPVLRVAGDGKSQVSGFASWEISLRGIDFGFDELEKNLVGSGYLRLRDTRVKGSLLLPLLSLRVGRLLLNKPFVIPNSTAHWNVKNGLVTTEPLKISSSPFGIRMGGTVTLRGHLDYIFHPGILIVPINVKGKWDDIKVVPTTRELLPKWPFR